MHLKMLIKTFLTCFSGSKRPVIQWRPPVEAIKIVALHQLSGYRHHAFARPGIALVLAASCWIGDGLARGPARVAETVTGVVTRVVDGDTVWLGRGRELLKVRLLGMDAPEICQAGGQQSRQALERRVLGKTVTVSFQYHDVYGRALGLVQLDGEDVGRWMVAGGHAWSDGFRHRPGPYAAEQARAQASRKGLFSGVGAQTPRSFRQSHARCYP
jgi:micrococcal nuclease